MSTDQDIKPQSSQNISGNLGDTYNSPSKKIISSIKILLSDKSDENSKTKINNEDALKKEINNVADEATICKEVFSSISELEQEKRQKIFTIVSELEQEKRQKIFTTVSELEQEKQQKIFTTVSELEQEKQQKIFTTVSELEQEKQQKIFTTVSELELFKNFDISVLLITYNHFINSNSIVLNFLPKLNILSEATSTKIDNNQNRRKRFRDSLYTLILKSQNEIPEIYQELRLEHCLHYFSDLERKFEILKSKTYLKRNKAQRKRINIFINCVLHDHQYQKLLSRIAKNQLYIEDYEMFDFVLFIIKNMKDKNLISSNENQYSLRYFKKYKLNYTYRVQLDDLFTPYGFTITKESSFDGLIGFDELLQATYITKKQFQEDLIDKYQSHPNKIYLYYALSQNNALERSVSNKILIGLDNLGYSYPYDKDIATIITVIKTSINKSHDHSDINQTEQKNSSRSSSSMSMKINNTDHSVLEKTCDTNDTLFLCLDSLAGTIQHSKSDSLWNYFDVIDRFLEKITSSEVWKSNNFLKDYTIYVKNLILNNERFIYYHEFYFNHITDRLKRNDIKNSEDHQFLTAFKYLKIQYRLQKIDHDYSPKGSKYFTFYESQLTKIMERKNLIKVVNKQLFNLYNELDQELNLIKQGISNND